MQSKKSVIIVALIIIVALGAFAYLRTRDSAGSSGSGEPVAVSGTTIDGQTFDLSQYEGKPVVINFFASWCPPCNEEAADLVAFSKAHAEAGFVGVATGDKLDDTKAFVDKYGIAYPVVFDGDGSVSQPFGFQYIPTTVFLNADHIETSRLTGAQNSETFEQNLEQAK